MEKNTKIIVLSILVFIVLILIFSIIYTNKNLKNALNKIENVEKNLDSAINEINYSKSKVDTIQSELFRYKSFIKDIQGRVEIMDLESRYNENKFKNKKDSISKRLEILYKEIGLTGKNLDFSDSIVVLH